VLNTRGIPQSGLLSISVGGMRKTHQLSSLEEPLRFACKPDDILQIKVDVLGVLGRARLPYQASEQKYTLPLGLGGTEGDASAMEVDLIVRPCDPDFLSSPSKQSQRESRCHRELKATSYLEEHGLVSFMQFVLDSLMQDKPADPYAFLQKQVGMRVGWPKRDQAVVPSLPTQETGTEVPIPALQFPSAETQRLPVPDLQDTDTEFTSILERLSTPMAAVTAGTEGLGNTVTPEDVENLEKEAMKASQLMRADNMKLRETAEQMNFEYDKLMTERQGLHGKLDAKRVNKTAKLQNELALLARENAKLVSDLARGREMVDLVKNDMLEIKRSLGG